MIKSRPSRAIASMLAISLVVSAPGAQAWGQVAAAIRPGSVGAGRSASAVAIAPASGSSTLTPLSVGAPSLGLSALPLSAPSAAASSLASVLAAPSAAAIPAAFPPASAKPAAARAAVSLSAVSGASAASKPAALTTSLSAAAAPGKIEGARGRLTALFDGLAARRPIVDAVDAENPGGRDGSARGFRSGRLTRQTLIPIDVTLADTGSQADLDAAVERLSEFGFRLDPSVDAVKAPGLAMVRGAIPAGNLRALASAPGVLRVAAAGRASASVPAPPGENLLRSGLRSLIMKRPLLGALAALPLQFAVAFAFLGPVMGGIALGGAAAVLKPWLLATALGMAGSFSYLARLFSWIPLKYRVTAAYAAAGGLAAAFYGLMPGLPALWLAANLLMSFLAARGSLATLAKAERDPLSKILNSTETSAFLTVIGAQATLPILLLGGMLPLAFGILAVSSALSLALLIRRRTQAAVPVVSPAAPRKNGPDLGNLPFRAVAPQPRARAPFVPATRVVEGMEKLLKTDPAAALKAAAALIVDANERRSEVKVGAQRILDVLPIEQTLPHYLELLKLTSGAGVQALKVVRADPKTSKPISVDPWWYLQRTALNRISREAAAMKPGTPDLIDALKTAYKDRNDSVRLAAAEALAALGVDPSPEVSYEVVEPSPALKDASNSTPAPQGPKKSMKWLSIGILAAMLGWMAFGANAPASAPPANPPAVTQPVEAPDSAAKTAAPAAAETVKADPRDAALEQIAKDTKRAADAAEAQAKAMTEMAKPKGSFMSTLMWTLLPILLLVFLMKKFMGNAMGNAMKGAGGLKKSKLNTEKPTTRFSDVAGLDETLIEAQEIVDFLRDPSKFRKLGARMPKGFLLKGGPGGGKTLIARAVAGETDATFISISGSAFVEMFVGVGALRVRELFEFAEQHAPALIFIDELDALGKKRGSGGPNSNDEREQTLNQLLTSMDGFDSSAGIVVIAATNRPETLDPALLRPGRLDRHIHVGPPEALGREAILALHAKRVRLSPEVDLRLIARRTAGLTGAFLENIINEAALLAARRDGDSVSAADIDEAVDRATIGGKRSLRLTEELKRRVATHEAGHVLANLLNENPAVRAPVNKVTILPHGSGALGFAESGSEEGDKYLYTRAELEARIDSALGGLVAEEIFYGEWSTGPGSDLEAATRVARAMVQQFGMSAELGLAQTAPGEYGQSAFGGEVDAKAHAAVNKLLGDSRKRVETRLRAGSDKHKAMIEALMVKETLSSDEIEAIAHPTPKP